MRILTQIMVGNIVMSTVGTFCCGWWRNIPEWTAVLMLSTGCILIVEL